MLRVAITLTILAFSSAADGTWHAIQVDGRPVDAWVPACLAKSSPIILTLHAWATSKEMQKKVDRLSTYAGSDCSVIVYPEGNVSAKAMIGLPGKSWNAGGCCAGADLEHVDDVGFLGRVIDYVAATFHANAELSFVIGISNGGMMANRLACSNPKVKALVAVSGPLINGTDTEAFTCDRSLPMLHLHGDADAIVPYDGCKGGMSVCGMMAKIPGFPPLPWPTVPEAIADWRARNGISTTSPATISFTNGSTTCSSWGSLANNVTLCKVGKEGHAWPGMCSAAGNMPGMHCSFDIDASEEAMRFFRSYIPTRDAVIV